MKPLLFLFAALGISPLIALQAAETATPAKPNIIFILADDMGYGDIGPFGNTQVKTPQLDKFAAEGMKFTSFYATPVCSMSRACLMTGCYNARVSIPGVLFPGSQIGLHPDETSLAEVVKQRGYATICIGKWHLGHREPFLPTKQGFDSYFGIPYSNDMTIDPHLYFAANSNLAAIRQGDWKLFLPAPAQNGKGPGGKGVKKAKNATSQSGPVLYNLAADPAETTDVAAKHPEIVAKLQAEATRREAEIKEHRRPAGQLDTTN